MKKSSIIHHPSEKAKKKVSESRGKRKASPSNIVTSRLLLFFSTH
jgi:hypothetical protein